MARTSSLRGGRQRSLKSEINVVPYIDVMLVLLIIFMVSAPLNDPGVINLPKAGKTASPPPEYAEITLKVDGSNTITIKGKGHGSGETVRVASREDLIAQLRQLHGQDTEMPVMIAAEKDVKYDDVAQVFSAARKMGVPKVGLVVIKE
ncbi:MAG TPA: ExbD/TolR family protein [Burkholderiaceae bacterium]